MEREALAEDDFIFKEIADYTYDWESWIDPDGATRWVNPAVKRITGYSPQECIAHADYPLFLVHDEDRLRVSDALEHARRHISGNDLEFRIAHKDGSIRWGAISWQDLLDRAGRYRGFRTSVRDITGRKVNEAELLSSRDEAYRASRAKSEFLATMSHEIRTPIQNILGCTQLLAQTPLSPEQAPLLGVMRDQGELLLRIVDDVLDFTALQSAQLRIEKRPFRLLAEVKLVVDAARGAAEAKNLSLSWQHSDEDADPLVMGDSHRLRQVLSNLVNNAIKFTDQGQIQIVVRSDDTAFDKATGRHRMRVEVHDSGIGISAEDQATLFAPFHQIDPSASRRHGGSGLGLSICKRLVELMEGTLQVQSVPGVGSTFAVVIPFEAAPKSAMTPLPQVAPSPAPDTPLSILVVEDTQVAREVIVALLQSLGQNPDAVGTAAQALEAIKQKRYQLLLMDKHMSGMDGLTLTRLIRADHTLLQPYIVAVTANVLAEARQACMAAGMDAFLGKPVRLADLGQLMKNVQMRVKLRKHLGMAATCFDLDVLQELQAVRSSGQSLLQKQAPMILSELKAALAYLAPAAPWQSAKEVQQWAHGIRGSLRTIGAKEAAHEALALEDSVVRSPDSTASSNALREALLRAHDAIVSLAEQP